MINYQNDLVTIRALEPEDLDFLFDTENDTELWKYSNRFYPYSKSLLKNYIDNADKDVFVTHQIKFAITDMKHIVIGFIDLFDFEPLHHRAAIGLMITSSKRGKGYATAALQLIETYGKERLQLHQFYANIASENKYCIKLFESQHFSLVGKKRDWNFYEGKFHDEMIYQKII
ncbi:MAG: GNAT family N-acetyltransferase [Flavobacteriales bacterium]|nr:GNAT family N-acetyltransferase [Flavobacteriales bacterium]